MDTGWWPILAFIAGIPVWGPLGGVVWYFIQRRVEKHHVREALARDKETIEVAMKFLELQRKAVEVDVNLALPLEVLHVPDDPDALSPEEMEDNLQTLEFLMVQQAFAHCFMMERVFSGEIEGEEQLGEALGEARYRFVEIYSTMQSSLAGKEDLPLLRAIHSYQAAISAGTPAEWEAFAESLRLLGEEGKARDAAS